DTRGILVYAVLVLGTLALAAGMVRTFTVTLPVPEGQLLGRTDAPVMWAMIEEVRRAAGCTSVTAVYVDLNLNAAAAQRRRFGFWGRRSNYLIIGLPMLLALTREQLGAVLAHEFAHLRHGHNTFSAWIYRVFQTWQSLD